MQAPAPPPPEAPAATTSGTLVAVEGRVGHSEEEEVHITEADLSPVCGLCALPLVICVYVCRGTGD